MNRSWRQLAFVVGAVSVATVFQVASAAGDGRRGAAERPPNLGSTRGDRPLCIEEAGAGVVRIRGRTYKAEATGAGVTYVPFLGARAPCNLPLEFDLRAVSIDGARLALTSGGVDRDDRSVEIDHGALVERWNFADETAEQTFRFDALDRRGQIEIRVAWDSELVPAENADGFSFASELGGVNYGRATAIDASGRALLVASYLEGREIVIVVPEQFVALAELPLVVDPVLSTFGIDVSTFRDFYADCAYDATHARWLVVYQDAFSATDFDVYSELLDANGAFLQGAYVDVSSDVWYIPHVANRNASDSFLVVSTTGPIGSGTNRHVVGRLTGAASLSYGSVFDISGAQSDYNLYPDVGGDPYAPGPSSFCVAWQREVGGARQIVHRTVTGQGTFVQGNPVVLDSHFAAKDAAVSKGNGESDWIVTWGRCPLAASNCDIWAAQVRWDGALTTPAFAVTSTAAAEYAAKPSSPADFTGAYMIVWQLDSGAHDDIEAALCLGGTVLSQANLSELEAADVLEDQRLPEIDTDGDRFVVTYQESYNGSSFDTDPYVASFLAFGNTIAVAERHVPLAFTPAKEENTSVGTRFSSGGAPGRSFCVWHEQTALGAQEDIRGALYVPPAGGAVVPYCFGDGTGTACPCGNSGGTGRGCAHSANMSGGGLAATGVAEVTGDSLLLTANGLPSTASCLFFQGTNTTSGSAFGDGLRCSSGTVIRLGTKTASSGVASYPAGGDLAVSVRGSIPVAGGVRSYQAWFRNAAAYCTTATFNLTNGVRVTWLP